MRLRREVAAARQRTPLMETAHGKHPSHFPTPANEILLAKQPNLGYGTQRHVSLDSRLENFSINRVFSLELS